MVGAPVRSKNFIREKTYIFNISLFLHMWFKMWFILYIYNAFVITGWIKE